MFWLCFIPLLRLSCRKKIHVAILDAVHSQSCKVTLERKAANCAWRNKNIGIISAKFQLSA